MLSFIFTCISWVITVTIVLLTIAYVNFKLNSRKYWQRQGIEYLEPTFIVGNTASINISKSFGEVLQEVYFKTKKAPIVGIWLYFKPILVVNDLELIKNILVKDFQHFHDRGAVFDEKSDPLSAHLFNLAGTRWRNLRVKLTPTFTSGKMKMMFPTISECGRELESYLKPAATRNETIEVKDILARFTTDVISSCAFGIQSNSLQNPDNEFRSNGKRLFKPNIFEIFSLFLVFTYPPLIKFIPARLSPKDASDYFQKVVEDTITYRLNNNIKRNDFLDLIMQLMKKGKVDDADHTASSETSGDTFTMLEAAAQAFVFFVAGFETSSATMVFALYELALNPDLRSKCQEELDKVFTKHQNQLSYDAVQELNYLECVINETLRKYPIVDNLNRECTKDYPVPGTNIVIKKGEFLNIPINGLQSDPDYYPNPEKFDPDRFTPEGKAGRDHYLHLPFGEGPRMCIGNRFGLLQTKVGLASILSKYNLDVSESTDIPLLMDPTSFTLSPLKGVHLKISIRK